MKVQVSMTVQNPTVALSSLAPGQTFLFANEVNIVIVGPPLAVPPGDVAYALLRTGAVYTKAGTTVVTQIGYKAVIAE